MSRSNLVVLGHRKSKSKMTDKEKLVYGYHYFQDQNTEDAIDLLSSIDRQYFITGLHKDVSRALLCQLTYKTTQNSDHGKEAEFYLIVYNLTKIITSGNMTFNNSGHFFVLKDELFKDFQL